MHITQDQGIVSPGDVILIPKGIWYWHGATRTAAMSHISVMKRGQTEWTVEEKKNWAADYDA